MTKKIIFLFTLMCCFILKVDKVSASILFRDNFDNTNGTYLENHGNYLKVNSGDSAEIQNNRLYTNDLTQYFYNPEITASDYEVCMEQDVNFNNPNDNETTNLYIRSQNKESFDGNYTGYVAQAIGHSVSNFGLFLYRVDNGSYTNLGISDQQTITYSNGVHELCLKTEGNTISYSIDGVTQYSVEDSTYPSNGYVGFRNGNVNLAPLYYESFTVRDFTVSNTTIGASPDSGSVTVGSPFSLDVVASSLSNPFNALRANVAVSSNLTVTGLANPSTDPCNLHYTETPSTTSLSFAGGIFSSSSEGCNVYTLTLTPNATGSGTIQFTDASVKAYADSSEILTGVGDASFTIEAASPSPSPTFSEFTIDNVLQTYASSVDLFGNRNASIVKIFVDGSDTNTVYPTGTTWEHPVSLSLGANTFDVYGENSSQEQTETQSITINQHTLGDINGDGIVDLIDASLFAVDWDKTENFTYILSDMNDDQVVNLTDLSILAKLQ